MSLRVLMAGGAVGVVSAACVLSAASRGPDPRSARHAFVEGFDRVLVAGFYGDRVSDRGPQIDTSEETSRLFRSALRARTTLRVIDSERVHLPELEGSGADSERSIFEDVAYWKGLGEEYREPLIVTGTVAFKRAGSQSTERQIGPRSVPVWRPRFKLALRLVFISGRTGEILESVSLGPEVKQASDERASALVLYLELMDRLMPQALALFGR